MMSENAQSPQGTVDIVTDLMVAYLSANHVPASEIPHIIQNLHATVTDLIARENTGLATGANAAERPSPAQIRKSIGREGIVSFIDGKSYKMLKRHLGQHGFDPDSYRARYGLPPDYPMVAQSHSERRSALAKAIGLGVRGKNRPSA